MTNDEARMSNEARITKLEWMRSSELVVRHSSLGHSSLGHSSFFRHSLFDIRHFRREHLL